MPTKPNDMFTDLRGVSNLAVEAIVGVSSIVESLHQTISSFGMNSANPKQQNKKGISGFVYKNINTLTQLIGSGLDSILQQLSTLLGNENTSTNSREAVLAALNGVLGDHLLATDNPLQIKMQLRQYGKPLSTGKLKQQIENSAGRLVILIHGSCMNDLQWNRGGHDHGACLARDMGITPIYLHYNSGLHISDNGKQLAALLETVIDNSNQATEIIILAHSMGGLLARSACYYAEVKKYCWPQHLSKLIFLGTPHHGAPLEKGSILIEQLLEISPYSAPFSRLLQVRSSGLTDLRHGTIIENDWSTKHKATSAERTPVPLPAGAQCYAIAASKSNSNIIDKLIGDGLVTVASALGHSQNPELTLSIPESQQWIGKEMGHWDLLSQPDVYQQIKTNIKSN